MAHDYDEQMSLMLDGRLAAEEQVALQAHLATCEECHARWVAFQQVDSFLSEAAQVMPAPGFATRFAGRLAQQQVQHTARQQTLAAIGACVAGAMALALIAVPMLIAGWLTVAGWVRGAPEWLGYLLELGARWFVTLRALGKVGESLLGVLQQAGGPIVVGYVLMLVLVITAWVSVMRNAARRWNTPTLSVLVWL